MDQNFVYSVSQLVYELKAHVESEYQFINVEGEVTNLSKASSGHVYFCVSDKDALISCALFKMDAFRNPIIKKIKDGDKIMLNGQINIYPKKSNLQIIVKRIMPAGEGKLKLEFEKLKKKLSTEGLFDLEIKKKVPEFPLKVGVITARDGAALKDFLKIVERRKSGFSTLIYPSLVQGDNAAKSLRKGLACFKRYNDKNPNDKIDVIVLMRGGGSLEDLWSFNDELLARDIFSCEIPTISAVGHEVDYSISDFVADLRCETPSAAAEMLTESYNVLNERIDRIASGLKINMNSIFKVKKIELEDRSPRKLVEKIRYPYEAKNKRLQNISRRFNAERLLDLSSKSFLLDECNFRLQSVMKSRPLELVQRLEKFKRIVEAYNPDNILAQGYSYLRNEKEELIFDTETFDSLRPGAGLTVNFHKGSRGVVKK